MSIAVEVLGWLFAGLAAAGSIYTVMAGIFVPRFFRDGAGGGAFLSQDRVTILKPLYGAEAGLRQNLESFYRQAAPGSVEIVFGVQQDADPALGVVEALDLEHPAIDTQMCLGGEVHGQNRKISNLVNMWTRATGDLVVLSDSDIGVPPHYLEAVLTALGAPGVGVVTCPYFGKPETGVWSQIAAFGLSYHFLPNVITGVTLGMANPCMGSTIALRRETLERIGGFAAFRDVLADDYAIGAAVRNLGLRSVVAPVLVSHSCTEMSLAAVFAHELRWAKTVRGVDPAGHAGSVVTHPLALALLAALLFGFSVPSIALIVAALCARVWLMRTVDRVIGRGLGPWWLIPMRDMLSFYVFAASFFASSVEWRGVRFHVSGDGDLKAV